MADMHLIKIDLMPNLSKHDVLISMSENDWNEILGAIKKRINNQIAWHGQHGSNADSRRSLRIAVDMERERLEASADRWDNEGQDDIAEAARALGDVWTGKTVILAGRICP